MRVPYSVVLCNGRKGRQKISDTIIIIDRRLLCTAAVVTDELYLDRVLLRNEESDT